MLLPPRLLPLLATPPCTKRSMAAKPGPGGGGHPLILLPLRSLQEWGWSRDPPVSQKTGGGTGARAARKKVSRRRRVLEIDRHFVRARVASY